MLYLVLVLLYIVVRVLWSLGEIVDSSSTIGWFRILVAVGMVFVEFMFFIAVCQWTGTAVRVLMLVVLTDRRAEAVRVQQKITCAMVPVILQVLTSVLSLCGRFAATQHVTWSLIVMCGMALESAGAVTMSCLLWGYHPTSGPRWLQKVYRIVSLPLLSYMNTRWYVWTRVQIITVSKQVTRPSE